MKQIFTVLMLMISVVNLVCAQWKNHVVDVSSGDFHPINPTVAIHHKNPETILIQVAGKSYQSEDGGKTWKSTTTDFVQYAPQLVAAEKNIYTFSLTGEKNNWQSISVHESPNGTAAWSTLAEVGKNESKVLFLPHTTLDRKGNLVMTWTEFDLFNNDNSACLSRILISQSSNGKKWSKPVELTQTPGNCKVGENSTLGAVATVTYDGRIFTTWINQGKIFMDRSFDGGTTWLRNDIAILERNATFQFKVPGVKNSFSIPQLISDNAPKSRLNGSLYLLWADQTSGNNDTDIWFSRSVNFGDNWTTPAKIYNETKPSHQFSPAMTVDQTSGFIYVVYYDQSDTDEATTDVYLAYSVDGGSTFVSLKINEESFIPRDSIGIGEKIDITAHKGTIVPVWIKSNENSISLMTTIIQHKDLVSQ